MAFGIVDPVAAVGSSLTIEELGPPGPGLKPRRVVLTGPSLPFMGAEWAFENNLVTTWYPGNGQEATQQILGPRELPSTWEGEWKRTLMGKHPTTYFDETGTEARIVSPANLREALEQIARAGVRLRVTWAAVGNEAVGSTTARTPPISSHNADGSPRFDRVSRVNLRSVDVKIVREGRVKTFRTPIDRATDIRWSIEFHWVSRGAQTERAASVREDEAADQAAQNLEASVDALIGETNSKVVSANPDVRKSATKLTLGQLENLAAAPQRLVTSLSRQLQQNVNDFRRVGEIAKKFRAQPLAVTNAVIDFARNTTASANNFVQAMGRQPPETQTNKQKVSALLRAAKTFGNIANQSDDVARRGNDLERTQRAAFVSGANRGQLSVGESSTTRAGSIIAIHVCKTGETPQTVSVRFFGNPDQAASILRANRLPLYTPTLRPGQIIVVPAASNAAATASA